MAQKYLVSLTEEERATLLTLTKKGTVAARTLTRAHILLDADGQATAVDMAQALPMGTATVERTRKRFVEEGPGGRLGRTAPPWGAAHTGGQAGSIVGGARLEYAPGRAAVLDEATAGGQTRGTQAGRVDGG